MTAREAYVIMSKCKPDNEVLSCYEYKTAFVFHAIPKVLVGKCNPKEMYDSLWSVNKDTAKVRVFNPMIMPIEEYRNGKRVTNFK